MKINWKLFPIKALYFSANAGGAPIFPFLPVIVRELGFSSVALGWIFTVYPVLTIFIKPFFGTIADKFNSQKLLLLVLLVASGVCGYCVRWVPPLPKATTVNITCDENFFIQSCSDKLGNDCFKNKIKDSFSEFNVCKFNVTYTRTSGGISESEMRYFEWGLNASFQDNCINFEASDEPLKSSRGKREQTDLRKNSSSLAQVMYPRKDSCISRVEEVVCYHKANKSELWLPSPVNEIFWETAIGDHQVTGTHQFWMIFSIIIVFRISVSIIGSLMDTICFSYLGEKAEKYGQQRMWGGIGWGMFSIISGYLIDHMSRGKPYQDYTASYVIMIVFTAVQILIVALIKVEQPNKTKSISKDVKNLFKNAKMCIFILWCIVGGVYTSFVWNFLFWFIEDLAAASDDCSGDSHIKTLQGLVLTVHTYAGEVPFFFLSGRILRKIGHVNAMSLVLFTFGLRFLLYSTLSDPWWILPIESLNGITFGIFYATMTTYANVISPPGTEATVQNLVTAVFEGVGTALGGFLGGYLFKAFGSSRTFLFIGSSAVAFGIIHVIAQAVTLDSKSEAHYVKSKKEDDKGITFTVTPRASLKEEYAPVPADNP